MLVGGSGSNPTKVLWAVVDEKIPICSSAKDNCIKIFSGGGKFLLRRGEQNLALLQRKPCFCLPCHLGATNHNVETRLMLK